MFEIYRFHAKVAMNTPNGDKAATYYLTPSEARKIAEALQIFADDAERDGDWPAPIKIDTDGKR